MKLNQTLQTKFFCVLIVCICVLLGGALPAYSDVVKLKTGEVINGDIITRTEDLIKIDNGLGIYITYYMDEIQSIDGEEIHSPGTFDALQLENEQDLEEISTKDFSLIQVESPVIPSSKKEIPKEFVAPPPSPAPKVFEQKSKPRKVKSNPDPIVVNKKTQMDAQINEIEQTIDNLPQDIDEFKTKVQMQILINAENVKNSFESIKRMAAFTLIVKIIPPQLIQFVFITWLLCCYPVMLLAKRLKAENTWLAFVPFLQFFLLVRMAYESRRLILFFLIPALVVVTPFAIPLQRPIWWFFVGMFFLVASLFTVPAMLWMNISVRLKKPKWYGILMIIPITNVCLHYYLAFEKIPPEPEEKEPAKPKEPKKPDEFAKKQNLQYKPKRF